MGATCDRCFFYWLGNAICWNCLADFEYDYGSSKGPVIGNTVELVQISTAGERPGIDGKIRWYRDECRRKTNVTLSILPDGAPIRLPSFDDVYYPSKFEDISHIDCPNCGETQLANNFVDIESLQYPRCLTEPLRRSGIILGPHDDGWTE